MNQANRREFLQKSALLFATLPVIGVVLNACTRSPNPADSGGVTAPQSKMGDGPAPVREEDPVATSLGYKMDANKVDVEKYPKRKGPDGQKQFCKNCQFYSSKTADWGDCQVIRAGTVNANGWCNSWAQKS
jgi:hypothetical protein